MQKSIRRFSLAAVFVFAVLVLSVVILPLTAQAPGPQPDEVTRALVGELRQLRIAVENLTSANSLKQILSMRANQHEQRLTNLSNQLLTMKSRLSEVSAETLRDVTVLEQIQERLRVEPDPRGRQHLEIQQQEIKANHNTNRLRQASLQAEVNQLVQQTMTEQSRLAEIQQRFDDAERLLREQRQSR